MILLKLTVDEILHYPEFFGLKLIAGSGGLSNVITSCGILDYEYDYLLQNKYSKVSFIPNQMVLSSLQYAKEDPGCLLDAIQKLHHKNCSCLVIKNVYSLKISPSVLRYADSTNFPIILIKNSELYFENIIINIYKRLKNLYDFGKFESIIAKIISLPNHSPELIDLQSEINPCLQPDIFCMYFLSNHKITSDEYMELEKIHKKNGLLDSTNTLLKYRNGFLFIYSSQNLKNTLADTLACQILNKLENQYPIPYKIGISSIHYKERKLKLCMEEAIYSSYFHQDKNERYQSYERLGIIRVLLPYCNQPAMQHFSQSILNLLHDYDSLNHTHLYETASNFVSTGGNLEKTACKLNQHKNTIRYRLNQISQIMGDNVMKHATYEQLSLALKIEYCCKIKDILI